MAVVVASSVIRLAWQLVVCSYLFQEVTLKEKVVQVSI